MTDIYMDHTYMDHIYMDHIYMDHIYMVHTYVDHIYMDHILKTLRDTAAPLGCSEFVARRRGPSMEDD